ncbi:MAG TPA: hypothetical protein VHG32_08655, partial [Thermoanaerobaculia bacterium]|nr:hypothetical protein [Thermoanaerobaculia bacterium]
MKAKSHIPHGETSAWIAAACLLLVAAASCASPSAGGRDLAALEIPAGRAVRVDGVLVAGEWGDAAAVTIPVAAGWEVRVLLKHDAANLYLAFTHLRHGEAERYPEVLLDPAVAGGDAWRPGQRWFHSSYNLCDGDGEFNVYRRGDRFLCAKSKPGWEANHAPLAGDGVMEIRIALSTLSPPPSPGKVFGLALDVTDTKASWSFWPAGAALDHPASWGKAMSSTLLTSFFGPLRDDSRVRAGRALTGHGKGAQSRPRREPPRPL